MGSDRARVSYDPSRHWRGVIAQQGRVTLEADLNEAATIAAEENRRQLLDVIGPAGTPDDGYSVVPAVDASGVANGDLTIKAGTMYVGGERMVLDTDLDYAAQPDWVDTAGDPLWVAPGVQQGDESVYLLLREQEVSAVEDPALLDVALGGPDTAERRRIVQRVVRGAIDGNTCAVGLSALEAYWAKHGLTFDPATMRLDSSTALQVSFQQDPQAATPCEPVAQGGYLGAENQLIRVQVASVDEAGVPTLVWGFDNAYFLYRVTVGAVDAGAGTTVLTLANAPVDSYHQPAKDQAVEVLQAAAELTAKDYIAETTGIVTTVDTAYQPDTQEIVISTALAAPTIDSPLLFLRVWQDTILSYAGGPAPLGTTGVEVTLSTSSGVYHPGDFWVFAVRPGTPTTVSPIYPQRILDAPQPSDGPRMWACPLAVVEWSDGTPTVIDCRHHFNPLGTCDCDGCCIDVSPELVDGGAGLQALIDRYASKGPVTFCLQPGTYTLPKPLVISRGHVGLTIKGCGPGVVLQAAAGSPRVFLLGLILLEAPRDFALREIELRLPAVELKPTAATVKAAIAALPQERQPLLLAFLRSLQLSIGVYALAGRGVTIEGCRFTFGDSTADVFGAGVFATRAVVGLELVDNAFMAPVQSTVPFGSLANRKEAVGALQLLVGYVQLPTPNQAVSYNVIAGAAVRSKAASVSASSPKLSARAAASAAAAAPQIGLPTLADARIEGNLFEGLTVPVLVLGQLGTIRVEDNTVRACYGGFWLVHAADGAAVALLERAGSANEAALAYLAPSGLASLGDPVFMLATVLARILPITPDAKDPAGSIGTITPPTKAILADAEQAFNALYTASSQASPLEPPAPEPAPEKKAAKGQSAAGVALPEELSNLFVSQASGVRTSQVAPLDPGTAVEPRLEVTGNQVDAVIAESDSGAGLLVLTLDAKNPSSLICNDNRFNGRVASGPVVSLWELLECVVAGNIVSNGSGGEIDRSLVLVPRIPRKVAAVAVTGNVLVGSALLPIRQNPPPFDRWDGLNTLMTVLS